MRGLKKIPNLKDLTKAYNEIQNNPLMENILLKYMEWVRLDPRLGEILSQKIIQYWKGLNPFILYQGIQTKIWPQVMGVLLDMAELGISNKDRDSYRAWKSCVLFKMPKQNFQQFSIGLSSFAGTQVSQQVKSANKIYLKWNYYGNALFYNKEKLLQTTKTLLNKKIRLQILEELIAQKHSFTVNDYLLIMPQPVSRRLAEMDLKNHPRLKPSGNTKNKIYSVITPQAQLSKFKNS